MSKFHLMGNLSCHEMKLLINSLKDNVTIAITMMPDWKYSPSSGSVKTCGYCQTGSIIVLAESANGKLHLNLWQLQKRMSSYITGVTEDTGMLSKY